MKVALPIATLVMLWFVGPASAFCDMHIRWLAGQTVTGYITTDKGCTNRTRSTGGNFIVATKVVSNAKHGRVQAFGPGHWTYTPSKGYRGEDTFTYAYDMKDTRGARTTATVKVLATVK